MILKTAFHHGVHRGHGGKASIWRFFLNQLLGERSVFAIELFINSDKLAPRRNIVGVGHARPAIYIGRGMPRPYNIQGWMLSKFSHTVGIWPALNEKTP